MLKVTSSLTPKGDQPNATAQLSQGILDQLQDQVLWGITGSGKTFTMAKIIETVQKSALIMAPNKTLAAQLYREFKEFFSGNSVEYFISYYDYYQPESYLPNRDLYIAKEATINKDIDRMRHAATRALFEEKHCIVVASVSCIYGLGSVENYTHMTFKLHQGQKASYQRLLLELAKLQYKRNDYKFERGTFRVKGDCIDIFPPHTAEHAWRVSLFGDEIERIQQFEVTTGLPLGLVDSIVLYATSHYITPKQVLERSISQIRTELEQQIEAFKQHSKHIEAQRVEERTLSDIEMLSVTGTCPGVENYSRYLSGREAGQAPLTLLEYFPADGLLFVDESHITVPQIGGMYRGDRARKDNLHLYGFRLPSCLDNRPLKFEEWDRLRPQTIFVSATPGAFELARAKEAIAKQVIRPTGLLDPLCQVVPTPNQINIILEECRAVVAKGQRVMITTLTKKMAESLTAYLQELQINVSYIHSDVETLERIEILQKVIDGKIDVLIGINLLREGLDIPQCSLVIILDADKQGFLRSTTSLIQTIGRAARNAEGRVIMFADNITPAMRAALDQTNERRRIQHQYNLEHNITPLTTSNSERREEDEVQEASLDILYDKMMQLAADFNFKEAAKVRDQITNIKTKNNIQEPKSS